MPLVALERKHRHGCHCYVNCLYKAYSIRFQSPPSVCLVYGYGLLLPFPGPKQRRDIPQPCVNSDMSWFPRVKSGEKVLALGGRPSWDASARIRCQPWEASGPPPGWHP